MAENLPELAQWWQTKKFDFHLCQKEVNMLRVYKLIVSICM